MRAIRCPFCKSNKVEDYDHRHIGQCNSCNKSFRTKNELADLLHELWGRARETDSEYRQTKKLWNRLRELLLG